MTREKIRDELLKEIAKMRDTKEGILLGLCTEERFKVLTNLAITKTAEEIFKDIEKEHRKHITMNFTEVTWDWFKSKWLKEE